MTVTNVRAHAIKHPTKHEKRQSHYHQTHNKHGDEQANKVRPQHIANQDHKGTHPPIFSHHSQVHVSNPNVHHHNAIHHSEAESALSEKLRKKASIAVTARTQIVNSKSGRSPYISGHPYPIKPPQKVAPTQPAPKAPHPTAPATRSSGAPTAPHSHATSPYASGHPYPINPNQGSYISGHPYPYHPFQAPDQSAKASKIQPSHTTPQGPLHPGLNIGVGNSNPNYGTNNPAPNKVTQYGAYHVSALNNHNTYQKTTNNGEQGSGVYGIDFSDYVHYFQAGWNSFTKMLGF